MLTVEQRAELWAFHQQSNALVAAKAGADADLGIPVPFKKIGNAYYILGWPAMYVAALCKISPDYEQFTLGEDDVELLPVLEIDAVLIDEVVPRLLRPKLPVLVFADVEKPAALEQPSALFNARDGSKATGGLQA